MRLVIAIGKMCTNVIIIVVNLPLNLKKLNGIRGTKYKISYIDINEP